MFFKPPVKLNLQNIVLKRYVLTEHIVVIMGDWDLGDSE